MRVSGSGFRGAGRGCCYGAERRWKGYLVSWNRRIAPLDVDGLKQPDSGCESAIGLHGIRVCGPSKGHGPGRGQGATARLQRSGPLPSKPGVMPS